MGYVYRYIDQEDNIIKYVGIVWGKSRTLQQRIYEHKKYDNWCKNKKWIIEYIESDINTRTDAEYFEAHYISLYGTDKWHNIKKAGWGISTFLPERNDWKNFNNKCQINKNKIKNESSKQYKSTYHRPQQIEAIFYEYNTEIKKEYYDSISQCAKRFNTTTAIIKGSLDEEKDDYKKYLFLYEDGMFSGRGYSNNREYKEIYDHVSGKLLYSTPSWYKYNVKLNSIN